MEQRSINQTDSQGRKQGYWEETSIHPHFSRGFYKDDLRQGMWEDCHLDGTLWIRHHYHQGKLHGVEEQYQYEGTLSMRGHYHHDERHGVWEYYYTDGTLWLRSHYHQGKRIREDSPETLKFYNSLIRQIGQPAWLSLPTGYLLFLQYTGFI